MRNRVGQDYFKGHIDLQEKKEKMYKEGPNASWGIDKSKLTVPFDQAIANKDICLHLMLPEVTSVVNRGKSKTRTSRISRKYSGI